MPEQHTILGGKVHVYKRPNSSLWQCSSYFAGKNRRTSTKEESLSKAKEIAEDWYLQLRGKLRAGEIKSEKTFREVSEHYLREYDIMTPGKASLRSRRPTAYSVQPTAYIHLPTSNGGSRYLPNRQKLPDQRRDD